MFLITIYLSYFYKIRKSGEINQIIQINKMSAFEKMASAFKSPKEKIHSMLTSLSTLFLANNFIVKYI